MVLLDRWNKPEAFPEQAYWALIWPDLFFIPLYLVTAYLLSKGRRTGAVTGVFSGGAVTYVMIYLLALSGLEGVVNLGFDGLFLGLNIGATLQVGRLLIL